MKLDSRLIGGLLRVIDRIRPTTAPGLMEVREQLFPGGAVSRGRERLRNDRPGRQVDFDESAFGVELADTADLNGVTGRRVDGDAALRSVKLLTEQRTSRRDRLFAVGGADGLGPQVDHRVGRLHGCRDDAVFEAGVDAFQEFDVRGQFEAVKIMTAT